jgi:GntR family transcriptional regulator
MLPRLHLQDNGVPVYVQIRDQMLQAIGAGMLRPGEQMPTMRQVAVTLKVDLNTVRHAYADLEQAGVIVILRARGTYVAERPPPIDGSRQAKRAEGLAQQAIASANSAGVDPIDVAEAMLQTLKRQRARK